MRAVSVLYDREVAGDSVMPARRIIDLGMRPVMEIDAHRYSFLEIETLVTRKDKRGEVWGPQQRIDRSERHGDYDRSDQLLGAITIMKVGVCPPSRYVLR